MIMTTIFLFRPGIAISRVRISSAADWPVAAWWGSLLFAMLRAESSKLEFGPELLSGRILVIIVVVSQRTKVDIHTYLHRASFVTYDYDYHGNFFARILCIADTMYTLNRRINQ